MSREQLAKAFLQALRDGAEANALMDVACDAHAAGHDDLAAKFAELAVLITESEEAQLD